MTGTLPPFAEVPYSVAHPSVRDWANKERVARQVAAILADRVGASSLATFHGLDVGCSTGAIAAHLGDHLERLVGVDVDAAAVRLARERHASAHTTFAVADVHALPFLDEEFSVVVCHQLLGYVTDPARVLDEIWRVLRPGGWCYLSAENRWFPWESQYRLPLLHLLPAPFARGVLHALGHPSTYLADHLGHRQLARMCRDFEVTDCVPDILRDPRRFQFVHLQRHAAWKRRALGAFPAILPTFIWLLRRPVRA